MGKTKMQKVTKEQMVSQMHKNGVTLNQLRRILQDAWVRDKPKSVFDKPMTYDELDEKNHEITKQYCEWLVRENLIHSRRRLKEFDMIDISDTIDSPKGLESALPAFIQTEEEIAFKKQSWYNYIPPLKRGVLRINRDRYIQFDTYEIDEADHSFTVILTDYSFDSGIWMIEENVVAYIKPEGKEGQFYVIETKTMGDLFASKKPDGIGWNEGDRMYWEKVTVPLMVATCEEGKAKDDLDLINHFFQGIVKTNYMLSQNKPKAVRSSGRKAKGVAAPEIERKKQIIRTVGDIKIRSTKIPRLPNEEVVRKYRVAAWNTRGHVRHYKDGKIVYVKPSVHHRKCLQQDGTVAQTVIQIEK